MNTPKYFLFALVATVTTQGTCWAEKPNIIVIYADDMGYGDCTVNNPESKIRTPNIDRLAKAGLRFTDAHSPASTCTASRYGLLTGTNPARAGVVNGLTRLGAVIDEDEVTLADFLKDQGYMTHMVGKWHLGFELHGDGPRKTFDFSKPLSGGPLDCGFDYFYGLTKAPSDPPYFYIRGRMPEVEPTGHTVGTKKELKNNGKHVRTAYSAGALAPGFVHEQCNVKFCDDAVRIIKDHSAPERRKPFFLYYAMLQPHTPWLPTEQFTGKSQAGPYGDYIVQLDHEVGRVLNALKESGLEENTLVIFSSDNGAQWKEADIEKYGHRANGVFSGSKGTAWEGGHRVPFIVRWPGYVYSPGEVTDSVINHTDLFATLAELFGVDLGKTYTGSAIDSHSFLHVLEDVAYLHNRPGMAITPGSYRLGDWKLRFARGVAASTDRAISDSVLHNLSEDPAEQNDVSSTNVDTKKRLFDKYQAFIASRKLKPLAIQVAARKSEKNSEKKRPPLRTRTAARSVQIPENLTDEQRAKVDRVTKEYGAKIAHLQQELDNVLTEEQKQARRAGQKQALAAGKKGVNLRAAADAAAGMTAEQNKLIEKLRKEIAGLSRQRRSKLIDVMKP